MAGPESVGDGAVILAALVLIADQQGNRRAGGPAFEDAGENLHLIRLAALRHMPGGARLATIQFGLDVGGAQVQSRWTSIDHAADCRAVRFAEGGDSKQRTECIAGHGKVSLELNQEFNMSSKKTPAKPSTASGPSIRPPARGRATQPASNPRQQADNRWQRSKHYGWDSR